MEDNEKQRLNSSILEYYKLKQGIYIPKDSYIHTAIDIIIKEVSYSQGSFRSHPLLEDMQSAVRLKLMMDVMQRKVRPNQNAAGYFNTICRREFETIITEETGHKAVVTTALLGHRASINPNDLNANSKFKDYANATEDTREKFINRKRRWSKEKQAKHDARNKKPD